MLYYIIMYCEHPKRNFVAGCEGCRAYRRDLYHRNKHKHKGRAKEQMRRYRKARLDWLNEIKEARGCADCGYSNPLALDFDHINGDKEFTISQKWGRSKEILLAEIEKCEVVCSNCHRIRTYNRAQQKESG